MTTLLAILFGALVCVDKKINKKEDVELLFKKEVTKDEFYKVMGWE